MPPICRSRADHVLPMCCPHAAHMPATRPQISGASATRERFVGGTQVAHGRHTAGKWAARGRHAGGTCAAPKRNEFKSGTIIRERSISTRARAQALVLRRRRPGTCKGCHFWRSIASVKEGRAHAPKAALINRRVRRCSSLRPASSLPGVARDLARIHALSETSAAHHATTAVLNSMQGELAVALLFPMEAAHACPSTGTLPPFLAYAMRAAQGPPRQ